MARTKDFVRYVEACKYPGRLDVVVVEQSLKAYLNAIGAQRTVRRLPIGWDLATEEPLRHSVLMVLDDFAKRTGRDAFDAFDVLVTRDARATLDASAARDARDALAARALQRFASWYLFRSGYWGWDWELSWMASWYLGALENKAEAVQAWTEPLHRAFLAGGWFMCWTDKSLFWVAKPNLKKQIGSFGRRLHCEDGPAVENAVENLYFIEGQLVDAHVVLCPNELTIKEVDAEPNAEVRRIMIQRMGAGRYLTESGAKLLDADNETARKGAAARCLLVDAKGEKWLVGTDGSTQRTYYMPVPNGVANCREAHCAIAGFDETKILAKS